MRTADLSPLQIMNGLKKAKKTSVSRESNNGKQTKSRSKQSSRVDDLAGKLFKTQTAMPTLIDESHSKKYPLGYYLPSTAGNRSKHGRNPNESIDFDSYLN